jgi:1-deoxy-D-xylulose-5-phosphate synthase
MFVKPLDEEALLKFSSKISNWITVEENAIAGGFGSAVNEWLTEKNISNVNLKMIGLPDKFIEQGPQDLLRARYGLDTDGIIQTAKNIWTKEKKSVESDEKFTKKDLSRQPMETSAIK